jgi:Flp pilus assembly protein TadB
MDAPSYLVAIVFGLVTGMILGRHRDDHRAIFISIALTVAIGVVTWLVAPAHIAGPSLTTGGVALLGGALLTSGSPGPTS